MSTNRVVPSGRPGRYQRSVGGLVGALIICVVLIVAFLLYRSLFTTDLEIEPEEVGYLETVRLAQDADLRVAYPDTLPDGWIATGVEVVPGEDAGFELNLLTDDDEFVGVRQREDSSPGALLADFVDPETSEAAPLQVGGSVAPTWEGWSDAGGDSAYTAEVGGATVMVYGSASTEELAEVVESLTLARVPESAVTDAPSEG